MLKKQLGSKAVSEHYFEIYRRGGISRQSLARILNTTVGAVSARLNNRGIINEAKQTRKQEILGYSEQYRTLELSCVEIAKKIGSSAGYVGDVFKSAGVKRSSVAKLIEAGESIQELAKRLGRTEGSIMMSLWQNKK